MLLFTDWVLDEQVKFTYGWHINGYLLLMVAINLYYILKSAARTIYLIGVKYARRIKEKLWPTVPEVIEE